MKASIVDLRYKMNDVLKALDRNEDVEVLYRGKKKGVLKAVSETTRDKVEAHPFFNSLAPGASVEDEMDALRGGASP